MLIVKVDNGGIDRAIKKMRNKIKSTKQLNFLRERQEYTKPSVKKRLQKQKAKYIQKLKDNEQE